MYKLFFSIVLFFFSFSFCAQNGETQTDAYFLTFNVKYGLKKGQHIQQIFMDIGTMEEHPFYGEIKNIDDEKVALGTLSSMQVFSNEVDLLFYLTKKGWEIVDVQNVKELATDYKQYLLKLIN